ncbi:MAG: hypothetical protein GXO11_03310, partial [Epsilonproteobacteria bacterium]|nr:hypothetical protein [Campylobacterota bacterium]
EILDSLSFIVSIAVALLTHKPQQKDFSLSYKDHTLYVLENGCLRVSQEAIEKLKFIKSLDIRFVPYK